MKKIISLLAACTLFAVCLRISAANAVTEASTLLQNSVVEQTDPYTFYFVPERTYVSAEEVQAGDVHIPTKVYIKGNTQPIKQITGARIRYQSDSSSLYFSNSSNILSTTDMYKQSYSGGSFFSEYADLLRGNYLFRHLHPLQLCTADQCPADRTVQRFFHPKRWSWRHLFHSLL